MVIYLVHKRIFVPVDKKKRVFKRKDKIATCYAICQLLDEYGKSSKSKLAKDLKRPYSRISEAVAFLYELKIIEPVGKEVDGRPGKPEIFYSLQNKDWINMLGTLGYKHSLERLPSLQKKLRVIVSKIRDAHYEQLDMYSYREWEANQRRMDYSSIREVLYEMFWVFSEGGKLMRTNYRSRREFNEYYPLYNMADTLTWIMKTSMTLSDFWKEAKTDTERYMIGDIILQNNGYLMEAIDKTDISLRKLDGDLNKLG